MIAKNSENNTLHNVQTKIKEHLSGTHVLSAVVETIVLTGAGFLLGYWFLPDAPLFSIPGFTWLIVGPLFAGLHYGFFYALLSVVLSVAILLVGSFYQQSWATGSIATIGVVLLWVGFIVGGFRGYWRRQINKLTLVSEYLDKQLSEITKVHSLTKISHDHLQELVISKVSLRDTVLEVRRLILSVDIDVTNGNLRDVAPIILRVLSDYGDIRLASVHEVSKNKYINKVASDSIGNRDILIDPKDPLLMEAINTQKTVSLKQQMVADNKYEGALILAIPLADSVGKIWGIVAVHQMPFRSYQPGNIALISTLAGYIGDILGRKVYFKQSSINDVALHSFLLQVQRCIIDTSSYGSESVVLGFEFKNKRNHESIRTLLLDRKRGLDQSWRTTNRRGNQVLFLLLPLTTSAELETYKEHIVTMLQNEYSYTSFREAEVAFHQKILSFNQGAADVIDEISHKLHVDMGWAKNSAERGIYALNQ
ncbi:MAG: hypothetical protein KAG19_06010 [Methylococcales bacterium]|nr:hypothetical protein [Methylococcales bacterium]